MPIGVGVLALGVFVVGTGEFVLAGLLPLLAGDFGLSIGTAGQVVTVFALTCAVAAPVTTTVTARWPRRRVLLTAGVIYLAGITASAVAPGFTSLLIAQGVAAIGTGMFVPNASVTAATLVGAEQRGRAMAVVITGLTLAVAFGAPAGTAIGAVFGWRVTLGLAAAVALVGVLGVRALIPVHLAGMERPGGLRDQLRPLGDPKALALLATTLVGFTAVYLPYTYVGAIFAPATGGDGVRLALLMLIIGTTGAVGNLLAGRLADRHGGSVVVFGALGWLILSFVGIAFAQGGFGWSVVAIGCYGIAAFAITTPQQHRLIAHDGARSATLVSLNQAMLYLAIGASGVIGAAGIDLVGAGNLPWVAAVLALLAIGLSRLGQPASSRH